MYSQRANPGDVLLTFVNQLNHFYQCIALENIDAYNKNAPLKRISTYCKFILCTSSIAFSKVQKEKKSGYVPFFNPLSLSDTDTIPTYKRVPKVVKFQISEAYTVVCKIV